ncbi:kinase-like domain-containing protein [Crepidotus variabilis]|uniref:Kinase-like domain-containing protein n=1 Tax=Crepidotus variabilis TaxID=179855 RepID=A0A9P6JUI5_9AGAR|nr:kinase-like domain-containing protein [Crepidotus variabilis]
MPGISKKSPGIDCSFNARKVSSDDDEDWSDEGTLSSDDSEESDTSVDEEDLNARLTPFWPKYIELFRNRGLQLDTVKDVKELYGPAAPCLPYGLYSETNRDDDLCPDPGLPDRLFLGTRISDSKRFVVKAVNPESREYQTILVLSRPPLLEDPGNHTIPVIDLFQEDAIAFIVMDAWSTQIEHQPDLLCCKWQFLSALRQCIEHIAFMHTQCMAHLDISLRNVLSDRKGRFVFIDYECTRSFPQSAGLPFAQECYGTEMPPETEGRGRIDPFKVDIWALGVLMLRGSKLTGHFVPELMSIIEWMLQEDPCQRPTAQAVLQSFNSVLSSLKSRLGPQCHVETSM